MYLEATQEEPPSTPGESQGEEVFSWIEEKNSAGRDNGSQGCQNGKSLECGSGESLTEFDNGVERAPEVCDFIFPEAPLEGKAAVQGLRQDWETASEEEREEEDSECCQGSCSDGGKFHYVYPRKDA